MYEKKSSAASRVGVVVPAYNNKEDLALCLTSLSQQDLAGLKIIVVDNASSDGTLEYVRSNWPKTTLVVESQNSGYVGGANRGWQELQKEVEYFMVLTQDIILEPNTISQLVAYLENNSEVAAVQPVICYTDNHTKVNSVGNSIHFLGFGYAMGEGHQLDDVGIAPLVLGPREVAYCSGAAMLLRASAIKEVGLFQVDFFMYHDDLDLGWRLRLAGYKNMVEPQSRAYHRYEFHRSTMIKYEFGERNRQLVLLENYRVGTLLLIFPAWFIVEIGTVAMSLFGGWFAAKLRGYIYILANLKEILSIRRTRQVSRKLRDRDIVKLFSSRISYQQGPASSTSIANPFLRLYWAIVRPFIFW